MKTHAKSGPGIKRKLQICVVFDEDANARNAEAVIAQVASDYECEIDTFCFEELDGPSPGVAAARRAAEADILILAISGDRNLPSHIRLWIGLCLGLRDRDREGALVALITQTAKSNRLDSSLADYLETVAIIGGLSFFMKRFEVVRRSARAAWPIGPGTLFSAIEPGGRPKSSFANKSAR